MSDAHKRITTPQLLARLEDIEAEVRRQRGKLKAAQARLAALEEHPTLAALMSDTAAGVPGRALGDPEPQPSEPRREPLPPWRVPRQPYYDDDGDLFWEGPSGSGTYLHCFGSGAWDKDPDFSRVILSHAPEAYREGEVVERWEAFDFDSPDEEWLLVPEHMGAWAEEGEEGGHGFRRAWYVTSPYRRVPREDAPDWDAESRCWRFPSGFVSHEIDVPLVLSRRGLPNAAYLDTGEGKAWLWRPETSAEEDPGAAVDALLTKVQPKVENARPFPRTLAPGIEIREGVRWGRPVIMGTNIEPADVWSRWVAGETEFEIKEDLKLWEHQVKAGVIFHAGFKWEPPAVERDGIERLSPGISRGEGIHGGAAGLASQPRLSTRTIYAFYEDGWSLERIGEAYPTAPPVEVREALAYEAGRRDAWAEDAEEEDPICLCTEPARYTVIDHQHSASLGWCSECWAEMLRDEAAKVEPASPGVRLSAEDAEPKWAGRNGMTAPDGARWLADEHRPTWIERWWRGPGFYVSPRINEILQTRGPRYLSSPTSGGVRLSPEDAQRASIALSSVLRSERICSREGAFGQSVARAQRALEAFASGAKSEPVETEPNVPLCGAGHPLADGDAECVACDVIGDLDTLRAAVLDIDAEHWFTGKKQIKALQRRIKGEEMVEAERERLDVDTWYVADPVHMAAFDDEESARRFAECMDGWVFLRAIERGTDAG